MKKILPILTVFLSSILFSPTSLGEWTYITSDSDNNDSYVDYDRIREKNGYVYYWVKGEHKNKFMDKYRSSRVYTMGDCELFRVKFLELTFFTGHMFRDDSKSFKGGDEWNYVTPNSVLERVLKSVCEKI